MTAAAAASAGRDQFPLIDVLRGAAALTVVVYHVIEVGQWQSFPSQGPLHAFRFGWIGVNLFLVISGFVIGLSALGGHAREGTGFRARFARRRAARIVPLYLLTGLAYLLLVDSSLLQGSVSWLALQVGTHLLFVHNLSPKTFGTINGPNWSVALEVQFYLLMLWITPWLARVPALRLLVGGLLAAALFRWVTTLVLVPGVAKPGTQHVISVWLPGVIDHFAVGIFLAKAVRGEAGTSPRAVLQPGWVRFAGFSVTALALSLLSGEVLGRGIYWTSPLIIALLPTLLAAGLACMVAAALTFPHQHAVAHQPLRYLGQISYGIYLWHAPVLVSVLQRKIGWQGPTLLAFVLAATLLLAACTWHLVEKPALERA